MAEETSGAPDRRYAGWTTGFSQAQVLSIPATALVILVLLFQETWSSWDAWDLVNTGLLLAVATVYVLLWYRAPTRTEEQISDVVRGLFLPPPPPSSSKWTFLAGCAFILLMVSSISPMLFGLVVLVIKVIETRSAILAKLRLDEVFQEVWEAQRLPAEQRRRHTTLEGWQEEARILHNYHFSQGWYQLAVTVTFVEASGAVLAAYLAWAPDTLLRHIGLLGATALMIGAIAANEVVADRLRAKRDAALERLRTREREEARKLNVLQRLSSWRQRVSKQIARSLPSERP